MAFDLHDIEVLEGNEEVETEAYFTALQKAINSLEAWKFQGSYGRAMMEAIKAGYCALGRSSTRDYYGNRIPSRTDVEPGTKGSLEFVRTSMGDDWANMIEGVE